LSDLSQKQNNEGEQNMENKIQQILADIESYKEAIEDARNALATAEQELDEALELAMDQDE